MASFLILFVATIIVISLSGCLTVGDGAARIAGVVVDERQSAHASCRLELMDVSETVVFSQTDIGSPFLETFVVSPKPTFYRLRVVCESSDEVFTSEPQLLGNPATSYYVPVDIGAIRLKRRQ